MTSEIIPLHTLHGTAVRPGLGGAQTARWRCAPLEIIIQHEAPNSEAGSRLSRGLTRELRERYPELAFNDDSDGLQASGAEFFVGYLEGEPVACGAFRPTPDGSAEIKRMYVALRHRGHGLARTMLDHLEGEARKAGYTRAVLETGSRQPEAQSLYASSGWKRTKPFEPHHGEGLSVFFEKSLRPASEQFHA